MISTQRWFFIVIVSAIAFSAPRSFAGIRECTKIVAGLGGLKVNQGAYELQIFGDAVFKKITTFIASYKNDEETALTQDGYTLVDTGLELQEVHEGFTGPSYTFKLTRVYTKKFTRPVTQVDATTVIMLTTADNRPHRIIPLEKSTLSEPTNADPEYLGAK